MPIEIVNTQADWFVLFSHLHPNGAQKILNLFQEVGSRSAEVLRTVKGRQGAGMVMAHLTDWNEPFGMYQLTLNWISRSYRGGVFVNYSRSAEVTLWYADKFGGGDPDYLSFGKKKQGGAIVEGADIVLISPQSARQFVSVITSAPENIRIPRPKSHKLYVDDVVLTPEPCRSPHEEGVFQGRYVTPCSSVDVGDIDVFELYERINACYCIRRGPGAKVTDFKKLPPLTAVQMNLILYKMGYQNQPVRNAVIHALIDGKLIRKGPESSYLPSANGVLVWNVGIRHEWTVEGRGQDYARKTQQRPGSLGIPSLTVAGSLEPAGF